MDWLFEKFGPSSAGFVERLYVAHAHFKLILLHKLYVLHKMYFVDYYITLLQVIC